MDVDKPTLPPEYQDETILKKIEADPNFPLGSHDAMEWAIAWRLIRDTNSIDANGDTDGWMCSWFANAMEMGELTAETRIAVEEAENTPTDTDRKWVRLSELHVGDRVKVTDLMCVEKDSVCEVHNTGNGDLYINCTDGKHLLDGEIWDLNDGDELPGFIKVTDQE